MSKKIKYAWSDSLVREFVADPNFVFFPTGEILTRKTTKGVVVNVWRSALSLHKARLNSRTSYWCVRYKGKSIKAHRATYLKFMGHLDPLLVINHKDGNGQNNNIDNLELVSPSENGAHAARVLGYKPASAKINHKIANEIRKDVASGLPRKDAAAKYGVSAHVICCVVNNKSWKVA